MSSRSSTRPRSSRAWSRGRRATPRWRSPERRGSSRRGTRPPSPPPPPWRRSTAPRPARPPAARGGLDAQGKPTAWTHRLVGPSILARWAPPAFRNGLDGDALDGAVHLQYDIPAIQVEYVRHEEPVLNTGFWRGVGVTHNTFVIESFIDALAAAAKQDPFEYRRALLGKAPRARAVLELAAQHAGWGAPLPAGRARGIALMYSGWQTYLAQVAEVAVSESGEVRVHRIVC